MTAFIGEYTCKVDVKGRIMFPSALKKQMTQGSEERFVVKRDVFEKCLIIYPIAEWERQNKIIRSKTNPYHQEHNRFLRMFYQGTAEIILDGSNRMLIPKRLLDYADIDNEVVLAGQYGKIEIWAKERYRKVSETTDDFAILAEKIMKGAINEFENE